MDHFIPVKFDIWDTYYSVKDNGDSLNIKCPCRRHSSANSWGLDFYTETVTNPNQIALIRKMVANNQIGLFAKDGLTFFSVEDVIHGVPNAYGWTPEDFD